MTGLVIAILTGIVILGGIRRIGDVCEWLTPIMSIIYIVDGFLLIFLHIGQLPVAFGEIFRGAFTPQGATGGFAGATVLQIVQVGLARGLNSNEAGMGSSPTLRLPHFFAPMAWRRSQWWPSGKETERRNNMKRLVCLILACIMPLALGACGSKSAAPTAVTATTAAETFQTLRHAEITIRDYGTVKLELDAGTAPITVENFVKLAQKGFYDGLTFHRIIDGFMIQGGDPAGNGTGGSGETIKGEFAQNGVSNPISHVKGVISMARAQNPDSASSQFFIVVADSRYLDGSYAAFGRVTEGMEIVEQIAADARPIDNNGTIPADQQPVIESIVITD